MLHSGLKELDNKNLLPIYKTGDNTLDSLLSGGFRQDLVYVLYGDRKLKVDLMINTMVLSFEGNNYSKRVALADMNNRFNPYKASRFAVSLGLSPKTVLENIIISRAFTFEQMVELLENKIVDLEDIKILGISGITTLWPNLFSFEDCTMEKSLDVQSALYLIYLCYLVFLINSITSEILGVYLNN